MSEQRLLFPYGYERLSDRALQIQFRLRIFQLLFGGELFEDGNAHWRQLEYNRHSRLSAGVANALLFVLPDPPELAKISVRLALTHHLEYKELLAFQVMPENGLVAARVTHVT